MSSGMTRALTIRAASGGLTHFGLQRSALPDYPCPYSDYAYPYSDYPCPYSDYPCPYSNYPCPYSNYPCPYSDCPPLRTYIRTFGAGAPASTAVAAAAGAAKPDTDGKFEPNLLNSIVFLVTSTMCVGCAAHGRPSQHTRGGRGYVERIYTDI